MKASERLLLILAMLILICLSVGVALVGINALFQLFIVNE